MSEPMAAEIMDEAIKNVTLDRFLDRHPSTLTWPDDFMAMLKIERQNRAQFIAGDIEKREKKREKADV